MQQVEGLQQGAGAYQEASRSEAAQGRQVSSLLYEVEIRVWGWVSLGGEQVKGKDTMSPDFFKNA